MKKLDHLKAGYSFQLSPVWPPNFQARLPDMLHESAQVAAQSASATAARRALLDSEDADERRRGARTLHGLSRAGDERIAKERA